MYAISYISIVSVGFISNNIEKFMLLKKYKRKLFPFKNRMNIFFFNGIISP